MCYVTKSKIFLLSEFNSDYSLLICYNSRNVDVYNKTEDKQKQNKFKYELTYRSSPDDIFEASTKIENNFDMLLSLNNFSGFSFLTSNNGNQVA